MDKFLSLLLIIALLFTGAIILLTQRYEAIVANKKVIIFDRLTSSFIEKDAKGEWKKREITAGDFNISFTPQTRKPAIKQKPVLPPEKQEKPAKKEPDFKI